LARATAAKTGTDSEHLFTFEKSPNCLACNFGGKDDQIARLNCALDAMKKDGSLQKIVDRHDPALKK
jgi:ABC-type amino acid transport substrate-binding protein